MPLTIAAIRFRHSYATLVDLHKRLTCGDRGRPG